MTHLTLTTPPQLKRQFIFYCLVYLHVQPMGIPRVRTNQPPHGAQELSQPTIAISIYITKSLRERKLRQGQNLIWDSNADFQINPDPYRLSARSLPKFIRFILLSASVISPNIVKIGWWLYEKCYNKFPSIPYSIMVKVILDHFHHYGIGDWRNWSGIRIRGTGSPPKVNHF